jgi:organic hydroperoxide reductase OsmC/OhrA
LQCKIIDAAVTEDGVSHRVRIEWGGRISTAGQADLTMLSPFRPRQEQSVQKKHTYHIRVAWTGNEGTGTSSHRGYSRAHEITAPDKPAIPGSSDPSFRGDATRWNPEELLLASASACHKLWYLGLCAQAGIVVVSYEDNAEGFMIEEADGAGQFVSIILKPNVTLAPGADLKAAEDLHHRAHEMCFIARSLNFPIEISATTNLG